MTTDHGDEAVSLLLDAMPSDLYPSLLGQLLRRMIRARVIDGVPGISFTVGSDGFTSSAAASFAMNMGPDVQYHEPPAG